MLIKKEIEAYYKKSLNLFEQIATEIGQCLTKTLGALCRKGHLKKLLQTKDGGKVRKLFFCFFMEIIGQAIA